MTVRKATEADIPVCTRMSFAFMAAAGLEGDAESVQQTLATMIETGGLFVVGEPVEGMAAVMVFDNYMKRSQKVAQELFWWVDEPARGRGAGIALLRALEAHARDNGAAALTMVALDAVEGDRVGALYERNGYAPLERSYRKVL